MKAFLKLVGFLLLAIITFSPFIISGGTPEDQKSKVSAQGVSETMPELARGRYVVVMAGCNDCE